MCDQFSWMSFRSFCWKYCSLYILSFCVLARRWTRQYKDSNTWLHTCRTAASWFLHFLFSVFFNTKLPIIIEPRFLNCFQRHPFEGVLQNSSSKYFRKIHRETTVSESFFNKIVSCWYTTLFLQNTSWQLSCALTIDPMRRIQDSRNYLRRKA